MKLINNFTFFAATASLALAQTPATEGNGGQQWLARLEGKAVQGEVYISQGPGGNGIAVQANFAGLPATGGPFLYHIHENPVNADGNCSSAGGHLIPYPSEYPCPSMDRAEVCEAGDLSGKHGKINGTEFAANYVESYVSNNDEPGCEQCMTDRALVVHYANKTAIACANFVKVEGRDDSTNTTASPSGTAGSTGTETGEATSTPSAFDSGAARSTAAGVAIGMISIVAMFL